MHCTEQLGLTSKICCTGVAVYAYIDLVDSWQRVQDAQVGLGSGEQLRSDAIGRASSIIVGKIGETLLLYTGHIPDKHKNSVDQRQSATVRQRHHV